MRLYVIGLIVDDTRAIDKLYLTGFRLADIPSELITDVSIAEARELFFANDGIVNLDSELKDLIDLPTTSADCSDSDIYNTYNDSVKYKHTVGAVSTFFGVCEVFGLDEKLLMMPKDCNILRINLGSISNGMSIVFSPYIQKFYIDQFSLRHNSSGVLELDFCFSSSTANNIV